MIQADPRLSADFQRSFNRITKRYRYLRDSGKLPTKRPMPTEYREDFERPKLEAERRQKHEMAMRVACFWRAKKIGFSYTDADINSDAVAALNKILEERIDRFNATEWRNFATSQESWDAQQQFQAEHQLLVERRDIIVSLTVCKRILGTAMLPLEDEALGENHPALRVKIRRTGEKNSSVRGKNHPKKAT